MGDAPSDDRNRLNGPSRPSLRSAPRRTQERRHAMIIGGGVILLVAASVVAVVIRSSVSDHGVNAQQPATAMVDNDVRTGQITNYSNGTCRRKTFDNQTGRMALSQQSCDEPPTIYDSHGVQVPIGTIHRLDTISKSFSGQ